MKWVKETSEISESAKVPIKSWCDLPDDGVIEQAQNLARHPVVHRHVALMPDAHMGYGMPIGGVIACREAVIPNAVGVDIGCGMAAVQTSLRSNSFGTMESIRELLEEIKGRVPVGEGKSHRDRQEWEGFAVFLKTFKEAPPSWLTTKGWERDQKNLGTLGGGNHFIELQEDEGGMVWLMLHSGSRNLGYRIAAHHHQTAKELTLRNRIDLPDRDLAFLAADSAEGKAYVRDMRFALDYARENRRQMMQVCKDAIFRRHPAMDIIQEINIHHNYANFETHFGKKVWVHRKGATSAREGELGIIPGSMGTSSYIVRGRGNAESFMSCSHGAGRKMGRNQACRSLTLKECDTSMEGIVFDRWKKSSGKREKQSQKNAAYDFGEAPQAYKDIDAVIEAGLDLIKPLVKLRPIGVIKG